MNEPGTFSCQCNDGFTGNGTSCEGIHPNFTLCLCDITLGQILMSVWSQTCVISLQVVKMWMVPSVVVAILDILVTAIYVQVSLNNIT